MALPRAHDADDVDPASETRSSICRSTPINGGGHGGRKAAGDSCDHLAAGIIAVLTPSLACAVNSVFGPVPFVNTTGGAVDDLHIEFGNMALWNYEPGAASIVAVNPNPIPPFTQSPQPTATRYTIAAAESSPSRVEGGEPVLAGPVTFTLDETCPSSCSGGRRRRPQDG